MDAVIKAFLDIPLVLWLIAAAVVAFAMIAAACGRWIVGGRPVLPASDPIVRPSVTFDLIWKDQQ